MKTLPLDHHKAHITRTFACALFAVFSTACGSSALAPSTSPVEAENSKKEAALPAPAAEGENADNQGYASGPGPSVNEIVKVIRTQDTKVRQCYMLGSFKNAQLSGVVTVAFTIATTGQVSEVSDAGSDVGDPELVNCVMDVFAKMEFRPGGASPTEITYPINFGTRG